VTLRVIQQHGQSHREARDRVARAMLRIRYEQLEFDGR
jgi:hypothetical protein